MIVWEVNVGIKYEKSMDSNNGRMMGDDLREDVIRACNWLAESLEQEPSAILEGEDMSEILEQITGGGWSHGQ